MSHLKEVIKLSFQFLSFFLLTSAIIVLVGLYFEVTTEPPIRVSTPQKEVIGGYTMDDFDFAMKYHGTHRVTLSSTEEPYFYREGYKIRLFTDDVKQRIKERK